MCVREHFLLHTGIKFGSFCAGYNGAHARLRGHPSHRVDRHVYYIGACFRASQHSCHACASCVVSVDVDGNVRKTVPQCSDQQTAGFRLQQAGHVLKKEDKSVVFNQKITEKSCYEDYCAIKAAQKEKETRKKN